MSRQILNEQEQRKLAKGKCPHCGETELRKMGPRFHFYLSCTKCRAVYYCHYPRPPVLAEWVVETPSSVFWRELKDKGDKADGAREG